MNLYAQFQIKVLVALTSLVEQGSLPPNLDVSAITVEPPRDPAHGDLATNAALVLSKPARMSPRAIADQLAERLRALADVQTVDVAGPGFINIRLTPEFWQSQITTILAAGDAYGRVNRAIGRKVNVEYVSANPTGPMHMGHCRGAVVGDALAALLEAAGSDVTREYYINDAGSQVDTLARSVHLRYQQALGRTISDIPEGLYPGDYLVPVGEALATEFGDTYADAPEQDWLKLFKSKAVDAMMVRIQDDLRTLGIEHDLFFSEQTLHDEDRIQDTLDWLSGRGLIYEGVLDKPKGEVPDDWEPRPQTLFRATQFGDDIDRPLKKSNGDWTYFAADIAYHHDKALRGFVELIDVWGADHGGYIKRMDAAVHALTEGKVRFDVRVCQMVRLFRAGEPVKMSKRSGSFVTLAEVVDEVGRDVVRFMMLTRRADAQLDFDFAKVVEQSKDNPVFYVHYAHARISSVLRKFKEVNPNSSVTIAKTLQSVLARLARDEELSLIRMACQWPRVVETAAAAREPHRIAFYLNDLASELHGLWTRGNEDPSLRFMIADDADVTAARMALLTSVQQVIRNGLKIMGVQPVEEM
jgi:arginyl-tRNA synthetase